MTKHTVSDAGLTWTPQIFRIDVLIPPDRVTCNIRYDYIFNFVSRHHLPGSLDSDLPRSFSYWQSAQDDIF